MHKEYEFIGEGDHHSKKASDVLCIFICIS